MRDILLYVGVAMGVAMSTCIGVWLSVQISSNAGWAEKLRHLEDLLSSEKAQRGEVAKRVRVLEVEVEEMRRAKTTVEEELNLERQKREKVSDELCGGV